jgi:hypothetical protein
VAVVLEEARLKTETEPVPKRYNGKSSKMPTSLDEKQKFSTVICIITLYTYVYVGRKTVRKKHSPSDNKSVIYTDPEIIFVHRTFFFYKRSLIIVGTVVLKMLIL